MSQREVPGLGNDTVRLVDATSGNETVTLPSNFAVGRKYVVRRSDAAGNTVTVTVPSGTTLDGTLNGTASLSARSEKWFQQVDPGTWASFGGSSGGGSVDPATLAADPAFTGTYGPGSNQWLIAEAGNFGFSFTTVNTVDTNTGLPLTAAIQWKDGKTGTFTGTIDSGGNGYTGWVATWVNGGTTKTVTISGITYDSNGTALGPTGLVVS